MKVFALTRYSRMGASSRMRTYQYAPALQALGIDLEILPLFRDDYLKRLYSKQPTKWLEVASDYFKRLCTLSRVRKPDLLWIEKELFPNLPACFEQILSALGVRYIVDYDDAIFHNYDRSSNPAKKLLAHKIDKVMRNASTVVCGNAYLADRARSAGASHVEIIPTVIDLDRYSLSNAVEKDRIVVGWIGSPSTVKYLEMVIPALTILAKEYPVQLRVVGAQIDSPGLDIVCRPWTEDSEVTEIQNFDMGIMPLIDSPWERGKCGYKLIQYMACGKPVIASPVGVNTEIVVPGINGYLASTADDWLQYFRAMCRIDNDRKKMGEQGRLIVEDRYCLQVSVSRLANHFNDCINNSR